MVFNVFSVIFFQIQFIFNFDFENKKFEKEKLVKFSSHFYFENIFLTKYITVVSQYPWGICSRVTLLVPKSTNAQVPHI